MNRKGFTLVEILIVVIILGILAAIVIPQFTEASNDARESALSSDLQTLRSQLELYRVQHLDTYPGQAGADMVAQLTGKTLQDGAIDAAGTLGPYLQKFPTNSFVTNGNTVTSGTDLQGTAGTTGWMFNTTTGQVWPGDAAHANL